MATPSQVKNVVVVGATGTVVKALLEANKFKITPTSPRRKILALTILLQAGVSFNHDPPRNLQASKSTPQRR
jgi:hypothetical protein